MNQFRILVVDDEEVLCEILQYNLRKAGYQVDVVYSAEEALKKDIPNYHLILLDIMMGEMSGFKMAHILRSNPNTANISIVFISAKDTENDLLTAYSLGADDYITKPFSLRELLARVNAVLSRQHQKTTLDTKHILTYNTLTMNLKNMQVLLDGVEIHFTKKEFEILRLFLENKNRLYTRQELLSLVWPEESYVLNRSIDVNINRIRKKTGPYGKNITTKLGLGYCFEE